MTYTIEKNIPIPENSQGIKGKCKYPFEEMEIGDSFELILEPIRKAQTRLATSSLNYAKRENNGKKFVTKITEKGARIWRVK